MYQVDDEDRVVELTDLPQSSVGSPCPVVLATEHELFVAYHFDDVEPAWEGSYLEVLGRESLGEPATLVRFDRPCAKMFGPPNDEAFEGHPLAARGLRPYGAFEVLRSSWVRRLERMNSVHPMHDASRFLKLRHFVLTFHDSTFECVASGYGAQRAVGPLRELIASVARGLEY